MRRKSALPQASDNCKWKRKKRSLVMTWAPACSWPPLWSLWSQISVIPEKMMVMIERKAVCGENIKMGSRYQFSPYTRHRPNAITNVNQIWQTTGMLNTSNFDGFTVWVSLQLHFLEIFHLPWSGANMQSRLTQKKKILDFGFDVWNRVSDG